MSIVDFEAPPVVETVLGVEFAPLEGWSLIHLGLYWDQVKGQFPEHKILRPLPSVIEKLSKEEAAISGAPRLELLQDQENHRRRLGWALRALRDEKRQENYTLSYLSTDGFFPGYAMARESVTAQCLELTCPLPCP